MICRPAPTHLGHPGEGAFPRVRCVEGPRAEESRIAAITEGWVLLARATNHERIVGDVYIGDLLFSESPTPLTSRVEHHWLGVRTLPSQPNTGGAGDIPV